MLGKEVHQTGSRKVVTLVEVSQRVGGRKTKPYTTTIRKKRYGQEMAVHVHILRVKPPARAVAHIGEKKRA